MSESSCKNKRKLKIGELGLVDKSSSNNNLNNDLGTIDLSGENIESTTDLGVIDNSKKY
jgi:hypothetical protein